MRDAKNVSRFIQDHRVEGDRQKGVIRVRNVPTPPPGWFPPVAGPALARTKAHKPRFCQWDRQHRGVTFLSRVGKIVLISGRARLSAEQITALHIDLFREAFLYFVNQFTRSVCCTSGSASAIPRHVPLRAGSIRSSSFSPVSSVPLSPGTPALYSRMPAARVKRGCDRTDNEIKALKLAKGLLEGDKPMGQVNVTLNGRTFQLWCGDGQEDYVHQLSNHIGRHISELKRSFGNINDDELFLMAGLLVADELLDTSTVPDKSGNRLSPETRQVPQVPPHTLQQAQQQAKVHGRMRQVPEPAARARVRPQHPPAPPRQMPPQQVTTKNTGQQPHSVQNAAPKIDDRRLRSALQKMSADMSRGQLPESYGAGNGQRRVEPVFEQRQPHYTATKRQG